MVQSALRLVLATQATRRAVSHLSQVACLTWLLLAGLSRWLQATRAASAARWCCKPERALAMLRRRVVDLCSSAVVRAQPVALFQWDPPIAHALDLAVPLQLALVLQLQAALVL